MKNLILALVISMFLAGSSNAHDGLVKKVLCTGVNTVRVASNVVENVVVASVNTTRVVANTGLLIVSHPVKTVMTPVRVVRNVQPVRTVLHNTGHPIRKVVRVALTPVRFVFGR